MNCIWRRKKIKEKISYKEEIKAALLSDIGLECLENKRVLITGATGMIGVCLIDLLMTYSCQLKYPVSILALARNEKKLQQKFAGYLSKENFSYVIGDINSGMPMIDGKIDFIIHAASNTHPIAYAEDPIGTIKTNVIGLDYLLDYAVKEKIQRFVFLSSIEIYGENCLGKERFSELDCGYINCNSLRAGYPESKRVGEALCQAYKKKYGLDVVIARLSRVYGPTMQMDDSKVISQFIRKAACKENIILKSDGRARYSYIYVMDAVTAILTILIKGVAGEAYNVANSDSETSILKLAEMIAGMAGTEIVFAIPEEIEKAGYSNVQKSLMSEEKLESLGWKPLTMLNDGVEKTIRYVKKKYRTTTGNTTF